MIGKTISHYKIIEKLGAGGMGEVYLAEDVELDRKVALKFLPPQYTEDPDINARFKREAKAAAALNHPNIITIYEVGEHEGKAFIAMEHVEGQELREIIVSDLTNLQEVSKVLDYATQICEGLAAAHKKGIVHRDIKPSNILVDSEDRVKIADFGLAKIRGGTKLTDEASTLGTLDYMSPEQIHGIELDHRSDIWSFGIVLYEMITGQAPFKGEYEAAISYSIINEEPEPLARYKTGVSDGLQRIVDKALDKEKETRYQNISDLLADLKREKRDSSVSIKPVSQVKKKKLGRGVLMVTGLTGLLAFIAVATIYMLQKEPTKQIQATHKQATYTGKAFSPAISRDGQFIAYVAGDAETGKMVMVEDLAGGQALEVFAGAKRVYEIRWSPTGSELMITATMSDTLQGIFVVPRLGGNPRHLKPVTPMPRWSPDGAQIASSGANWKVIKFTNKSTDESSLMSLPKAFTWLQDMDWSPIGNRLSFLTQDEKRWAIWTTKTDGTQQYKVLEDSLALASPRWSATGNAIYYLRDQGQTKDFMKVKIASVTGKAEAPAKVLQSGLQIGDSFTLSGDNKRLLYTRELEFSNLWLASLQDKSKTQPAGPKPLTTGTSSIHSPSISPDGEKIAFSIGQRPKANIFAMPLEGGDMQQLTYWDSYNAGAVWSPDGKELAFGSTQDGETKVWRIPAEGGTPRPFANSELSSDGFMLTWSPGSNILYQRPGNQNFHILNPRTEEERLLVKDAAYGWMFFPRYSPDGERVAIAWNRYSAVEDRPVGALWVISLKDTLQTEVRRGSHYPIEWSEDGQWIYAWNDLDKSVEILKSTVSSGQPQIIMTLNFENLMEFSMTPDRKRLVYSLAEAKSDVWVMENFDPESELEVPFKLQEWPEGKLLTYEQKGLTLARQGKHAEAEKVYRQGLELNPNHPGLLTQLGRSLQNQKKYAEAEEVFRKGLDLRPKSSVYFSDLGWNLLRQSKHVEAEKIFLKGLELDPKSLSILDRLVLLNIETKNYNAAQRYAEKYIAAHAQFQRHGKRRLGEIELLRENYRAAEKHLREVISIDSTYVQPYRLLSYLFAEQKRYGEALNFAQKSLSMDTGFANYNLMAWVLIAGEIDIEQGIELALKALETKPEDYSHTAKVFSYLALPEYSLGLAYLKKSDYQKVTEYLETATELLPERQNIYDDLQLARQKLNETTRK